MKGLNMFKNTYWYVYAKNDERPNECRTEEIFQNRRDFIDQFELSKWVSRSHQGLLDVFGPTEIAHFEAYTTKGRGGDIILVVSPYDAGVDFKIEKNGWIRTAPIYSTKTVTFFKRVKN